MRRAAAAAMALVGCLEAPPEAPDPKPFDAAAELDPSLVLWYPMDVPPQGGVVTDEALDHDADCADCPALVEGRGGGAFEFEPNDSLSVEDGDRLRTPEGTWAVWARFDDVGFRALATRPIGSELTDEMALWIQEGRVSFTSGPGGDYVQTQETVTADTWVHVAATWTQEVRAIYLDGVPQQSQVGEAFEFESVELVIGADRDFGDLIYFLDGQLDDLRMYDRALSEDEIAALAAPATTN